MSDLPPDINDHAHELAALGIAPPPGIAEAVAAYAELQRLVQEPLPIVTPGNTTAETLADDLFAIARAEQVKAKAGQLNRKFGRTAAEAVADLFRADADRIIGEAQAKATADLKELAKLTAALRPDDTAATVVDRDDAAVKAWKNRDRIAEVTDRLHAAHAVVTSMARYHDVARDFAPLWWVDVNDAHAYEEVAQLWKHADGIGAPFFALLDAGYALTLRHPSAKAKSAAAVLQSRAKAEEEHQAQHQPRKVQNGIAGYVQYHPLEWTAA